MNLDFDCFSDEEFRMVSYLATNECVEAVVNGLSVQKDDLVLAVCGSGDVPFALVEKGAKVVAVDVKPIQIEYARWRLKKLVDLNFDVFFKYIDYGRGEKNVVNRDYFSVENRLSHVKEYADRIAFQTGDIFKSVGQDVLFNKIYLSNVLGFSDNSCNLANAASHLAPNGLLYVTQDRFFGQSRFFDLPEKIVDDLEYTTLARKYEQFWVNPGPTVLRKEK